jgi:hypothetical protein
MRSEQRPIRVHGRWLSPEGLEVGDQVAAGVIDGDVCVG